MTWEEYKKKAQNSKYTARNTPVNDEIFYEENRRIEELRRKREEQKNNEVLPTANTRRIGSALLNTGKTIELNSNDKNTKSKNVIKNAVQKSEIKNKQKEENNAYTTILNNRINTPIDAFGKDRFIQDTATKRSNNESIYNKYKAEQIKEDIERKAIEQADNINKDMKKSDYKSAIGHILSGIPQKALDSTSTTFVSMNSIVNPNRINQSMANPDALLKANRELTSQYEKTTSNINNNFVKTASGVSGTIGGMTPSIISNIALPGSGAIVQGVNVGADAYQDTLNEESSNKLQATVTGLAKGIVSGLIEKVSGGNIIGKGSLDDSVSKFIGNHFNGKVGQKLASKAYEIIGEIGEENLENQLGYVIDKIVNNKELPNFEEWWKEAGETTKGTFLTTLVLNTLGLGGSTYNDVQDIKAQQYLNEAKSVIRDNLNNSSMNINKKTNLLNDLNNINTLKDYDYYLKNNANLPQNQVNNVDNIQTQQITQKQDKMSQNQTSTELNDMLNNKELPMQSYQYEKSNNVKINNLRKDANRYFNNSEKARNYVSMLEKIITDKDIEIRLDSNLKTTDGRIANGSYSNGVITINPNSTKVGEFIAVHELTHAIGTKEMLNMVNTYRKSNIEFDTDMKSLLQNYNETEISEEALSDVAGQLFGNQEFINNIAQENPNIFQKIYSEIKYLWHQFRGYKNQNQFVEDLYYKWTQAYNSKNKLNETSNYSIAGTKGMNNAIKQDTSNLIIEQSYNKALQMAKNNIDNEVIRQNTGWFQDRNGDWKFEFSDKNMSLKSNIKLEKNKTYKLNQILEHDILFQAYPELANYNVKIFSSADANGSFNKSNKTINISDRLINNSRLIEGTLIHEIQHAIQNIEGFEGGKNSNKSRLAYYNSLGEIEASNTKDRFIKEKYNNKNMTNIAPESSKTNPKHKNLDNYLKNRNLLDKVKDSVYNYFNNKNGGNNNEINQEIVLGNTEQDSSLVDERGYRGYVTENSNKSSFSMQEDENNSWQQYLDKNFKPIGTRTNMQEILPTAQNEGSFSNIQAQQKNKVLNNITNIEEPKSMELPSNEKTSKENKIAKVLTTPIKKQKTSQRLWAIVQANFIDKGAVFETLSLKTKVNGKYNRELQSKWDATLSSSAKGQYAIGNDRYVFKNGKKTLQSKSLSNIIEEVGDNPSDFYNYMYHQLNIDRMTLEERFGGDTGINYERKEIVKNKPVFGEDVTADISRQIVAEYEEKFPKFKSYAQDVYDFLDANKQELVNSGVISQELSDKFKEMYPHYVPIARVNKNNNAIQVPLDTNRTGINNPIKRAKGGSNDIQPLFHTMADRTLQTYRASARNAFGVELKNTLEINNLLNYTNENTDVDTIIDTMEDEQQTGLTEGTKYKNPTFTVFENGKKVTFDINQDMYDALKPQSEFITKINNTKASKFVNEVSNIRRGMLTEYNPLFAITNAIKDVGDVFIHSQHALKTYSKMPEAIMQIIKKGYWNGEYLQNGGKQNSYFKDGEFEQFERKNILQKSKNVITLPLRMISAVNNVIEMTPRLAEYIASRQMGESIETSMLDASRVTTNFKAGGDITKLANRNGFTFLNAGVQGASQVVRNLREANAKGLKGYAVLATKFTIAGVVPVLLNNLFWGDDDDYEELQDYVKDNYYIIGKIGEHEFIRIPKARVASVIQKLFSTANKYITKGKEINIDNFAEDFWANLMFAMDNIAPNNPIENNIASPLIQVAKNETWYGDDLVPNRLQNVPKTEQYDETTDKFSIWLGKTLGLSPMKINYLLDQYGGGVSDVLLPLGTPQAENNVFTDKFTTNSVIKSKYPGEFFEKSDKLKINSNSMNATDEDNLKYKYISSISKETSDLYKKKREIQSSTLSDEEKKKQILEIQKQINSLSKEAIEKVEKTNINGNTAIIGGKKYYKTTDIKDATKTWKELTEEEIEKNKNISLTTYTNYKEQVAQETIKQRKNGTIKEDGSIKSKDKISILINSKYSNVEKQALYENYILSDADKKYAIVKDLFKNKPDGLNINKYLKYKLADSNEEFKSDRKDDGTEDGKAITGSGNIKRFDYIDSIEGASYTQKLILYALDCKPSTRAQKDFVANYIRTNYKGSRQKEVLKIFGAEIYKDGTFKY